MRINTLVICFIGTTHLLLIERVLFMLGKISFMYLYDYWESYSDLLCLTCKYINFSKLNKGESLPDFCCFGKRHLTVKNVNIGNSIILTVLYFLLLVIFISHTIVVLIYRIFHKISLNCMLK